MNIEFAYSVLEILQTMQDVVKQMINAYDEANVSEYNMLCRELEEGVQETRQAIENLNDHLRDSFICVLESIKNIRQLEEKNPHEARWKLECELLMILENSYIQFFAEEILSKDASKKQELHDRLIQVGAFPKLLQKPEEREYACDLSIFVPAYNHVDYTIICVNSILENIPSNITCEIILYNHGSSDATKQFFESLSGVHVLEAAINRAFPIVGLRAMSGRYSLYISNDVVVGANAIENMYRTIAEHSDCGWVVPSTSAVSNLQTIAVQYSSQDEFVQFAKRNNLYDERRHEARVRLCNPATMIRTEDYNMIQYEMYEEMYCIKGIPSFPDDKISLWMRRHGYKNILAKDAYCHHFGSVTHRNDFKSQQQQSEYYLRGRKDFVKNFGVDPWGTGFCYDSELFSKWQIARKDNATILGINCGLGSNSLKVKEIQREKGAEHVTLYNAVEDARYIEDLQGISDKAFVYENIEDIVKKSGRAFFDYVVLEDGVQGYNANAYLRQIRKSGLAFGEMAYKSNGGTWKIIY